MRFSGKVLVLGLFVLWVMLGCTKQTPLSFEGQPNFVIILIEDLRYDALTGNHPMGATPNLDQLARQGFRFNQFFTTQASAPAAKAAILTGRYNMVNGVNSLADANLARKERPIAKILAEQGYETALVGKWPIETLPKNAGFSHAVHFFSNGPYYNREVILNNGQKSKATGFIEDFLVEQSIAYIQEIKNQKKPFALVLAPQLPHYEANGKWNVAQERVEANTQRVKDQLYMQEQLLTTKPVYLLNGWHREKALSLGIDNPDSLLLVQASYYAAVSILDEALGKFIEFMKNTGLEQNTYVIVAGTNGFLLGEHKLVGSLLPYENAIRTPLIMKGPGIAPGSSVQMTLHLDLAPTILALASVPLPKNLHGESLIPLLKGEQVPWRDSFLYEAQPSELGTWPCLAIRTKEWKYIQTFDINEPEILAFEELYNLKYDPFELNNLASGSSTEEVVLRFSAELAEKKSAIQ
jgi:N-acetylglucosamine-6-sulfatase